MRQLKLDSILSPNRVKIFINTSWLILERLFRIGLGFFVTALVARYLGPKQFGLLSYAISIVAIVEPLANLGLNTILKKYFLYNPESRYEIQGSVFALRFASSLLFFIIMLIIIPFIPEGPPAEVRWVLTVLSVGLLFKIFDLIDLWYESQVQSKYTSIIKSSAIVLSSIAKLLFIKFELSLLWFALATILEGLICTAGYIWIIGHHGDSVRKWRFHWPLLRNILKEGTPLMIASLAVMIYMKIDQIMLLHMAGEHEVGLYAAAVKLSEPWGFIAVNIVASIFPTLVMAKKASLKDYYNKLQKLFSFMTLFAIIITLPISYFSSFFISTIFGANYIASAPILSVHIWANIFIFWAVAQDPWDIVEKHTKFVLFKTIFAAFLNIGLNLYLIPTHGGLGAAWATVVSYSSVFFLNSFHKKSRKAFIAEIKSLLFWRYLR
ncbi:MAG: flippase [Oligoflexia bacterium]|nr:flippase [Oligoflexia bacterium]